MDLIFLLQRTGQGENCTLGTLTTAGFHCFSCEPLPTARHPDIPPGQYEIQMYDSPKFKRFVPRLINVPERGFIEVHPGDTGEDTEGCILLGLTQTHTGVWQSRDAVHQFCVLISAVFDRGDRVYVRIDQPASPFNPVLT